jgi:hypothetical protein
MAVIAAISQVPLILRLSENLEASSSQYQDCGPSSQHAERNHATDKNHATNHPWEMPPNPPDLPARREDRFPSVEERVKLYMADWYVPPCENYTEGFVHFKHFPEINRVVLKNEFHHPIQKIHTQVKIDRVFAAYPADIAECRKVGQYPIYCKDIEDSMVPTIHRLQNRSEWDARMPLLAIIGDRRMSHNAGNSPVFGILLLTCFVPMKPTSLN